MNCCVRFVLQYTYLHVLLFYSTQDVLVPCKKVLEVPGQRESNFDISYEIGYAYMRLEEYDSAIKYLMAARRINGKSVCLRMALKTLQENMRTTATHKRRWRAAPGHQQDCSKRVRTTSPGAA